MFGTVRAVTLGVATRSSTLPPSDLRPKMSLAVARYCLGVGRGVYSTESLDSGWQIYSTGVSSPYGRYV